MNVFFSDYFKKRFFKLPPKIKIQFEKRLQIFIKNPAHPLLRSHPLKGNLVGYRAFSVTGDYRVIYRLTDKNAAKFMDIGPHAHVYN